MIAIVGHNHPIGSESILTDSGIVRPWTEFVYSEDTLDVVADTARLLGEFSLGVPVE